MANFGASQLNPGVRRTFRWGHVTDDYSDAPGRSYGDYGPPARWVTVVSPVAPESVAMVLAAERHWQVKPLGSRYMIFGRGVLQAVLAEGEVSPTETGSRVHIALHRAEPSRIPATAAGLATLVATGIAYWSFMVGRENWWTAAVLAGVGWFVTVWQSIRLGRRVSDEERAALASKIVKALRGREMA